MKENALAKKAQLYIKNVKDSILQDYVYTNIKLNKEKLLNTKDEELKKCINIVDKNITEIDYKQILAFNPTFEKPKPRHRHCLSMSNDFPFNKNKGKELYLDFAKKHRQNTAIPKVKDKTLNKRLAGICSPYNRLIKDGSKIAKESKKTWNSFKKKLLECREILKALDKDQDRFQDPVMNFNFYIWKTSKLCIDNNN